MKKKRVWWLLLLAGVGMVSSPLLRYAVKQGWGQMTILWQARPIAEVLRDPHVPDSLRSKLRLVARVKAFAVRELGLCDTDSYETLFDQRGRDIMWVVTACKPFAMDPRIWHFPLVGQLPYKGFFDRQDAYDEARRLEEEGWDVRVSVPAGWSTLGWLPDPLMSDMLAHSEGRLAALILHEMMHATVFIKDHASLNENLASFVADTAAYRFLAGRYGPLSAPYLTYRDEMSDRHHVVNHFLSGAMALDSLYSSWPPNTPLAIRRRAKKKMISRIVGAMDTLSLLRPYPYADALRAALPNNSYFMTYLRYHNHHDDLRETLNRHYGGDLNALVASYAEVFSP